MGTLVNPGMIFLSLVPSTPPSSSVNMFDIPSGGFSDTPLLVNLLHAIHLSGPFSQFRNRCSVDPNKLWICDFPASPFPTKLKSIQSAAMNALSQDVIVQDMYKELHKKLKITPQPTVPFEMPVVWYEDLLNCIKNESPYIKLCWLKTACGAWCTASRLSTYKNRPCIIGCEGERDEMCHHLQCPILWQLASEALSE